MRVALVCIAKNEDDYIQEWIDYHLKLGFDEVVIYKNNWNYEINHPQVKTIQFDGQTQQMKAYNNFIDNNSELFDWAAFFDVDEFLVLKKHQNIKDFLKDYSEHDNVAISWVLFGDNGLTEFDKNNTSVLKRFTKRQNKPNTHIKTITKVTPKILFTSPHCTTHKWISPDGKEGRGSFNKNPNVEIAQLNHYFCKTRIEFQEKINRGRADTTAIRTMNTFDSHNINEVDDFLAMNFLYPQQ